MQNKKVQKVKLTCKNESILDSNELQCIQNSATQEIYS